MALQVTGLERKFVFEHDGEKIELNDPNPDMEPAQVKKFYANTYPELTNANVEGPEIVGDSASYSFTIAVGTKG